MSPVDETAVEHWDDYTAARNLMLKRTHSQTSPWTIVQADDKKAARLAVIHDLLNRLEFKGRHTPPADGVVVAIDRCGRHLAEHFPTGPDNPNELPDTLVETPPT